MVKATHNGIGVNRLSRKEKKLSDSFKFENEKYQILSCVDETNPYHSYQLVTCYFSQGCPLIEAADCLSKVLMYPTMTTIIIGDFNFDTSNESNPISKLLKSKNLQQIVKWPTHDAGRTLDHCWVSTNAGIQLER